MKKPIFTLNEIGKRENLEDAISPNEGNNPGVYLVCDGVGGSNAGEIASNVAVNIFYNTVKKDYLKIINQPSFEKCINKALSKFLYEIESYITENPFANNTSTTLTAAVVVKEKVFVAWCGDSRIYHVRDGNILFKSKDHSLVQDLVDKNVISEEEAIHHPNKNIIFRSISQKTKFSDIDFHTIKDFKPNDWLLLCSDGLNEHFDEQKIQKILNQYDDKSDYETTINDICKNKTNDNYSMILLHNKQNLNFKKMISFIAIFLILGVILFALLKEKDAPAPSNTSKDTVGQPRKSGFKTSIKDTTQIDTLMINK